MYAVSKRFLSTRGVRDKFSFPHDARIVTQISTRVSAFVFSVIALRMSYIAFEWAQDHAHAFNHRYERICDLLEEQTSDSPKQIHINIQSEEAASDAEKQEKLTRELWELVSSCYDYDEDEIECKI